MKFNSNSIRKYSNILEYGRMGIKANKGNSLIVMIGPVGRFPEKKTLSANQRYCV